MQGLFKKFPLTPNGVTKATKITGKLFGGFGVLIELSALYDDLVSAYRDLKSWCNLVWLISDKLPCSGNPEYALSLYRNIVIDATALSACYISALKAEWYAIKLDFASLFVETIPPTELVAWFASGLCNVYAEWTKFLAIDGYYVDKQLEYSMAISQLMCDDEEDDDIDDYNDNDYRPDPSTPPTKPVHDPSGYVYEGIANNRLQGVTATAYYKENVEDMYGDLHENIVKWDAEEYAQENPLFTDENGYYRWDVPQGLWQVKFEKEGYETTYSDWLPVPPPQLDVNIAMKQNRQPEVKAARAYEDAVEVEFDKYMMAELLTAENIMVMQNGTAVEGTIELVNEEVAGWRLGAPALQEQAGAGSDLSDGNEETFASKIRFNAKKPFTAKEVTLMVSNRVKSYAGIRMQDNYEQTFAVEEEIKEIACDAMKVVGYGESSKLVVQVLPASASKGKVLNVKSSSPMILSVDKEQVTIGNDGKAVVTMTGELPGTAALTFTVEGTDKEGLTIASVEADVIKGDVNGDRLVNGTDIVALVNVIMSSTEYPGNPDVNGDGLVNGTDLVALVNIIMGAKTARAASMARGAESPASLSVEKFNVNAGGTKKMLIDVNNQGMDVTMVEFNMKLPAGLTVAKENGALAVDIAGRTDYKSHQLETALDDGVLHVLLHSDQNSVLTGNDGAVLSVRLVANQEIVNGEIVLEQQLLTAPDLAESKPEKYIYGLGTATGIAEIEDGRQTTEDSVYDLQGRKSNEAQAGKGIIIKNRKKVAKY